MSQCDSIRDHLDAFHDGLLDENEHREIDSHLSACAACREFVQHSKLIGDDLRRIADQQWIAPAGLWRRIENSYAQERGTAPAGTAFFSGPVRWATAALVVLTVAISAVMLSTSERMGEEAAADTALVSEFHTFVISRRDLDYNHSEPLAIREWFSNKVDFRVPMPIRSAGYDLTGGRLCNLLDQRIVSFMYLARDAWVSLYILKPVDGQTDYAESEQLLVQGYGYIKWVHDGLQYSLVGDIPVERLRLFADQLNAQQILVFDPVVPLMTTRQPQPLMEIPHEQAQEKTA